MYYEKDWKFLWRIIFLKLSTLTSNLMSDGYKTNPDLKGRQMWSFYLKKKRRSYEGLSAQKAEWLYNYKIEIKLSS